MKVKIFTDVDKRWSKWHGQRCPICKEGTLADGVRERSIALGGATYSYQQTASWCGHCDEGLIIHNPIREIGMEEFLEAQRRFAREEMKAL
ncbi:MAG: YgiT-type zinc finger protein [Burkholderiaceae bacterium]